MTESNMHTIFRPAANKEEDDCMLLWVSQQSLGKLAGRLSTAKHIILCEPSVSEDMTRQVDALTGGRPTKAGHPSPMRDVCVWLFYARGTVEQEIYDAWENAQRGLRESVGDGVEEDEEVDTTLHAIYEPKGEREGMEAADEMERLCIHGQMGPDALGRPDVEGEAEVTGETDATEEADTTKGKETVQGGSRRHEGRRRRSGNRRHGECRHRSGSRHGDEGTGGSRHSGEAIAVESADAQAKMEALVE
jgi:hypothetical protein